MISEQIFGILGMGLFAIITYYNLRAIDNVQQLSVEEISIIFNDVWPAYNLFAVTAILGGIGLGVTTTGYSPYEPLRLDLLGPTLAMIGLANLFRVYEHETRS